MAMPEHLVLVRHGQSEANIVQKRLKQDPTATAPAGFFDRHDSRMRLSMTGREQARSAGDWLRRHGLAMFDRYYVSPHIRTAETAANLRLEGQWSLDVRWRERDWGEYGVLNEVERGRQFALSQKLKEQNKWYWCPPGGESLATGVHGRFRDILDTLHRETAGQRVIAVTHGEMIDVARFVLERLTPEEWLAQDADPAYRVSNCQILHYTRRDPDGGRVADRIRWVRSVCPWDEAASWHGGSWTEIHRRLYTDTQLAAMVERHPLLLDGDRPSATES
jgi:broad specificity phosphatase PhoE